jgi:hypothetical protein
MQQFWWGHQNKSKVHWMSWSQMALAKADGGLAIEILGASIRPCWQNRVGGFGSNPIVFSQKLCKQSIIGGVNF